jgi:hypothetical protein
MAKRGPGKFDTDLDAAVYEISLNGADGEVGSSSEPPGTWAGLIRRGPDTARAIEYAQRDSVEAGGGFHDVSREDLEFLRTKGKAGAIIMEHGSGRVEVAYYASESDLEKDWAQVEKDLDVDEEEFEENGDEDILRDETIEPYLKGKGPVFRVQTWETEKRDPDRFRGGRPMLGFRITMTEPSGRPEVVYEGEDYSPSPMVELDSDRTIDDIVAFFTSDYVDEDDEGVSRRTARQKEVVREHGDTLSGEVSMLFGEDSEGRAENGARKRSKNGSNAWVVTLNGEQVEVVYMADDMDADAVKRSLVNHDGYDSRITVKKRPRRMTHAPDALAENRRR